MTIIPTLDFPDGEGPPTYWKLVAALERLLADEPEDPLMRAMREEADEEDIVRPVPVTQKNVAIESGKLSRRKHISGEKCTFPRLAAFILSLRSTHGVSENTTRRLERQSEDIALLDQKVRVLRSRVLAAVAAKDAVEDELADARQQILRLERNRAA